MISERDRLSDIHIQVFLGDPYELDFIIGYFKQTGFRFDQQCFPPGLVRADGKLNDVFRLDGFIPARNILGRIEGQNQVLARLVAVGKGIVGKIDFSKILRNGEQSKHAETKGQTRNGKQVFVFHKMAPFIFEVWVKGRKPK
jgi:hypothetical protein